MNPPGQTPAPRMDFRFPRAITQARGFPKTNQQRGIGRTESEMKTTIELPFSPDDVRNGGRESEWKWYASRDEENCTVGPEASRDAIIAAATRDYDGERFHIVEARKGTMERWVPSGSDIIDQVFERSSDDGAFGDDYGEPEGTPEQIKAAEEDLDALLTAWYARHKHIFPEPWQFAESRNCEWITPLSDPA